MKITKLPLQGLLLIEPRVFPDPRGSFFEAYREDGLQAEGVPRFVQDNQSLSAPGVLRGLHYQLDKPQGKLVRALSGAIFDVAVDIRKGSADFGRWHAEVLTAENHKQLYIPPGFAHAFCVMGSDPAAVLYKCTDYYSGAADQRGVIWNDSDVGIEWPVEAPLLSEKDLALLPLNATRADLPTV